MGTRDYNFSNGPETASLPTATTPSATDDFLTLGFADARYMGAGFLAETTFTFANNQSSVANVTGCLFSSASCKSAKVDVAVRRSTNSSQLRSWVEIYLTYDDNGTAWQVSDQVWHGDDPGLTFSVTAGGQVQYVSTNVAGSSYSGASRFRADNTFGT